MSVSTDLQVLCDKQEALLSRLKLDLTKKQQTIVHYEKLIAKHEATIENQMMQISN